MVSWGDIAVGGERHTSRNPARSAIVGLLAAALGIRRKEEERILELSRSICIGSKILATGTIIKDFHTVQVPKSDKKVTHYSRKSELSVSPEKISTVLSIREYLCDSLAIVAVLLKDGNKSISLSEIQKALLEPVFQLYLGRKSAVPALPLQPQIIEAANLKDAFNYVEFSRIASLAANSGNEKYYDKFEDKTFDSDSIQYFWEDSETSGFDHWLHRTSRYDELLSVKRRQFTSRDEYMAVEIKERGVKCI